jgi:hypothetical protein
MQIEEFAVGETVLPSFVAVFNFGERVVLRAWCEFSELVYISLCLSYHGVSSPNSVQNLGFWWVFPGQILTG